MIYIITAPLILYLIKSLNNFIYLNYNYEFNHVENIIDRHPSWIKAFNILKELEKSSSDWDILVVMDTDAWIKDPIQFKKMIEDFKKSDKIFAFAEEPLCSDTYNDFVKQIFNGGFTVLKNTKKVKEYFNDVWKLPDIDYRFSDYKTKWPWEQICLNHIYEQYDSDFKDKTWILPMMDYNSPIGSIVTHSWPKDIISNIIIKDMIRLFYLTSLK